MSVTFYAVAPGCLPCCNANTNYIAISCRTIGGTANFVGCSEFGFAPSVPPRYYRLATASGGATTLGFSDAACSVQVSSIHCDYTGWIQYDANTGAPTTGGTTICGGVTVGTGSGCGNGANTCLSGWVYNLTSQTRFPSGNCCDIGGGTWNKSTADNLTITLSDEDLETDAIARLIAASNYSAWQLVGDGSGGTCIVTQCCESNYQSRTSNVFTYVESQYRANIQNANTTSYSLIAELWRAPSGFSNYALYSYQITPFTTNATGFASVVVGVPITKGYATYATNVEYY